MQAFLNADAGLHSALPFTAACGGDHPWATGSRGQLNCEKDAPQDGATQRSCWGQSPQAAAARPTAGGTGTTPQARGRVDHACAIHSLLHNMGRHLAVSRHSCVHASCWLPPTIESAPPSAQVQSLRFMPGVSVSNPAHALALLNSSSLAHRGRYGVLPGMSNLLPHGPFGTAPSNALGSGPGGSGSGGACSPYRPAATSSQVRRFNLIAQLSCACLRCHPARLRAVSECSLRAVLKPALCCRALHRWCPPPSRQPAIGQRQLPRFSCRSSGCRQRTCSRPT